MKKIILAFLSGTLFLSSCSKNDVVTPTPTAILASNVPSLVLASMSRNYPAATQTNWVQTAPTAYMATFKQSNASKTATFQATGALSRVGDVIDPTTLPAAIIDYLKANYAGYIITQADVKKDAAGAVKGYETLIMVGTTQYELEFSATGAFTKLETPDGHAEANGVAVSALPVAITTYLTVNYVGYTIHEAESTMANGVATGYKVEIVQNNIKYNVLFDTTGKFLSVNTNGQGDGNHGNGNGSKGTDTAIAQKDVPAAAVTYLDTNYKGYAFVSAVVEKDAAGVVLAYEVKFTLAGKSYEAEFDAAGKFVKLD